MTKKKVPQDSPRKRTIGDDEMPVQLPTASLFGLEAPLAGAIVSVLGKAGIDLGVYAFNFFSQKGPFQVCVEDSQFAYNHHLIQFLAMNCSPHGIYVEKLDVNYTAGKKIHGVRLQDAQKTTPFGYPTKPNLDSDGFPKHYFTERALPFLLPPGGLRRIIIAIPKVEGQHDKSQRWGKVTFSLTYVNDGKQEDLEQDFGLRW